MPSVPSSLHDMLYGSKAIAEHLGIRQRQVFHLIETGRLPHFRAGKVVCARRSTLTQWLACCESSGAAIEPAEAEDRT